MTCEFAHARSIAAARQEPHFPLGLIQALVLHTQSAVDLLRDKPPSLNVLIPSLSLPRSLAFGLSVSVRMGS